jgi:hypothetical protein
MSSRHRTKSRTGSRKLALVATITASLLLKSGLDRLLELWTTGHPTMPVVNITVICLIIGLIAGFIAWCNSN